MMMALYYLELGPRESYMQTTARKKVAEKFQSALIRG
jgi:hypothetical protein